jgi:hypothetical protein
MTPARLWKGLGRPLPPHSTRARRRLGCEGAKTTTEGPMRAVGRSNLLVGLLLVAWSALATPMAARGETTLVDLQLVLAVDVSASINDARFQLQKQGYAAAFLDPRVLEAIGTLPHRAIAVAMMQWTGPSLQADVVDWALIDNEASAARFAREIVAVPRALFRGGTSISGAIDHAVSLFERGGFRGERRVIDISGDGANNSGRASEAARDDAVRRGIIINGLPILTLEPDLDAFYGDNVIGGPGSFVIAVDNFDEFASAILRKLILEISAAPAVEPKSRIVLATPSPVR